MKKLCVIVLFCFLLTGCVKTKSLTELRTESITYAAEHTRLFEDCAKEIFEFSEKHNLGDAHHTVCKISMQESGAFLVQPSFSENVFSLNSENLSELFCNGGVKDIYVRKDAIEFGVRYSPEKYYKIIYTPSGELSTLFGYNEDMTFQESEGGWLGELPDSIHTFFYFEITDNLYYTEAKY